VTASKGTCTKGLPVECSLGDLAPGETVTIKITGQMTEPGRVRNFASATSAGLEPEVANNLDGAQTRLRPTLRLRKVASDPVVEVGENLSFKIRVTNTSRIAIERVRVCDPLPGGLAYVSSDPKADVDGRRVCWQIRRLARGASKTFRVVAEAQDAGRVVNKARASAPGVNAVRGADSVEVTPPPACRC
jgi:uncharacterized repeat protein (TIGR01451 family)